MIFNPIFGCAAYLQKDRRLIGGAGTNGSRARELFKRKSNQFNIYFSPATSRISTDITQHGYYQGFLKKYNYTMSEQVDQISSQ